MGVWARLRRRRGDDAPNARSLAARAKVAHRLDDDGWAALVAETRRRVDRWQQAEWLTLPVRDRVALSRVAADARADVERLAESRGVDGPTFLVDRRTRRVDLGIGIEAPDWLLVAQDRDLVARVAVEVAGSSPILVAGLAFVSGVAFDPAVDTVRLDAVLPSGARVPARLVMRPDAAADAEANERWADQTAAAWWAEADVDRASGCTLEISLVTAGIARTVAVEVPARPGPAVPVTVSAGTTGLDLAAEAAGDTEIDVATTTHAWGSGASPLALPTRRPRFGHAAVVATGRYAVTAGVPLDLADPRQLCLPLAEREIDLGPVLATARGWSPGATGVSVVVRTPIPVADRGRRRQRLLLDEVRDRAGPLQERAVVTCFVGAGSGDSVGPIAVELLRRGIEVDWCVADLSIAVPEGVRPVLLHSREWHEAFTHARYLVNNAEFPHYVRFRDGQRYLQTWHGTPLKRIADDIRTSRLSAGYAAAMAREVAAWECLLAQNAFAGRVLPGAFGFTGRTLVEGYPRNDALVGTAGERLRATTRADLGLGDDLVVLYAPTWRDAVRTEDGRRAFVSHLDADQVHAELGATVLVRSHANAAAARGRIDRPGVVDVTAHPDVTALLAAADVLVTDYSSVMFDFAVTGRPQVFLVPDLAEYRDEERGLYLDLAEIAPGPLVTSTGQVVEALRDPGAGFERARAEFRARFAPLDDGEAARRVVDAWWR